MKIAIYNRPGSFSDRWCEYAERIGHQVYMVDVFRTDLHEYLNGISVQALLMHPPMADQRTILAARAIVESTRLGGIRVFPTPEDFWHFDDKLSQKYIFEALRIPFPTAYAFFDKISALKWANSASYPVVFKLRAGAGSINVQLVQDRRQARVLIRRMFGRGIHSTNAAIRDVRTKLRAHKKERDWLGVFKRAPKTLLTLYRNWHDIPVEKGYAYFQEFIDGNAWDTRITVIGNRAFGFRRLVRPGDFRASGSGAIEYDPVRIDLRAVRLAFDAARKLRSSCMAFDFVVHPVTREPLVVEMSFAFKPEAVHACPGYWDDKLQWREGHVWPQDAIFDDLLRSISQ